MCARQWALPTLDHGARSSPTPPHSGSQGPSAWVMRWCARLAPGSEVLDLACGSGRHSRVLAALGCRVDAVDVDAARAADLDGIPGVQFRALDLERGPWPFQRSEEHTSELQSRRDLVCRLLLEKKKQNQ